MVSSAAMNWNPHDVSFVTFVLSEIKCGLTY